MSTPSSHADRAAGAHAVVDVAGSAPVPASLPALLHARADQFGSKRLYTFLADGENEAGILSFEALRSNATILARTLRARIKPGSNVMIAYPPGLEFIVAFFACLEAGMVAVPACPPHPRRDNERLAAIANDCGARHLLATHAITRWAASAPELIGIEMIATNLGSVHDEGDKAGDMLCSSADASPGNRAPRGCATLPSPSGRGVGGEGIALPHPTSLAFLQYTSGSTSSPRGVRVTHANVMANLAAIHAAEANSADSRGVSWLPSYHDMGLIEGLLQPLYGGYSSWLMPHAAFLQRPVRWLRAISRHRASVSGGPNFAFDACIRRVADDDLTGLDLQCWKVAYCGAEPVQADTLERFAARFERCGFRAQALRPVYGLAEATLLVAASDPAASRPQVRRARRHDLESGRFVAAPGGTALVSCGRPQPGTRIAIVDPVGMRALPEGNSGEIWVSGPAVADGYCRREHDADSFRWAEVDGIGARWLCTGDLGLLLDGELYVSGRRKDLIILRGRKLHPQDIEHTVQALLASRLDAVAAFALQKSEGEGVVVLAELRHGVPADEPASLADRIRSQVYRCHDIAIDALGFVRPGSLARTSSGKLMRFRCRQDFIESRLRLIARFDTPASGLALAMRSA
jgi:acyl-CoA synthetase (AMP-forming)/AMP-acid ligase II